MIYIVIFLLILYWVYKYDVHKDVRYKKSAFWGLCVMFILLASLRYRIGGDTLGYMLSWELYPDFWNFNWIEDISRCKEAEPEMERYQPGWFLFVMFFLGIWKHQLMMQFAVSILLNYAIFKTIKKYSKYPFTTLFIYFFNFKFLEFEFEIMRESVAVALFLLLAFDNYVSKKWVRYYIGTFLVYMIHPSAIFMFILPFFRNLKISLRWGSIFFMALPICVSILGRIILGDLLNVFLNPEDMMGAYMTKAVEKDYNTNYILMYIYQPIMIYILIIFLYKKIKNSMYLSLIFFALFFIDLSLLYFTASRLVNYIIIPVYIGITPLIYSLVKKYNTIFILPVLLCIYNIPTIFEFQRSSEMRAKYFPYQDYIFQKRSSEQKIIDRNFGINDE